MRMPGLHVFLQAAVALVALCALPAHAEIVAASGSSGARAVVGAGTRVAVDWRVQVAGTQPDRSLAVISSEAFITLEGDVNDPISIRVGQPLKRLLPPTAAPATQTAVFREQLGVPAPIADLALATGLRIFVVREFRDQETATPVVAMAQIPLGGGNSARLSVSRIVLRFPDGASDKILARHARSHVLAEIRYTGAGRLHAVWEIAEPSSTAGEPMFRTLSSVHRNLVRGSRELLLRSPGLPSGMEGLHLLRLRLIAPDAARAVIIRYAVNAAMPSAPEPARLIAHAPAAGAVYRPDQGFHWSPVENAAVYQIEFFTREAGDIGDRLPELGGTGVGDREPASAPAEERYPDAGIMVTAISTRASLSRLTLSQLTPGRVYDWRVTAYDAQGRLIGASALRGLAIPP